MSAEQGARDISDYVDTCPRCGANTQATHHPLCENAGIPDHVVRAELVPGKRADAVPEYFGVCPECWGSDGALNIGPVHIHYCDRCKTKWRIGENLFSAWQDENDEIWDQNDEKLSCYREVEPTFLDENYSAPDGNAFRRPHGTHDNVPF